MQQQILPDKAPVSMLGYVIEQGGRTLVNPVLRMERGTSVRVRYWNALDETSIVHWHGLTVDTNNDGHPHYAVGPGETYDYQFTVSNRAGPQNILIFGEQNGSARLSGFAKNRPGGVRNRSRLERRKVNFESRAFAHFLPGIAASL